MREWTGVTYGKRSQAFLFHMGVWLSMILAPQCCFLLAWALERLPGEGGLVLGGGILLMNLAADVGGARQTAWLLSICGLLGAGISARLAFCPGSVLANRLRHLVFPAACAVVIFAAYRSFSAFAFLGATTGVLALLGLMYIDARICTLSTPVPLQLAPTRPSLLIYAVTLTLALALYLPGILSVHSPGYDESFSLLHYAALGPAVSLVRYDFPNNHIAYNFLVSLMLPAGTASLVIPRLVSFAWFLGLLIGVGEVARVIAGRTAQLLAICGLLLHDVPVQPERESERSALV